MQREPGKGLSRLVAFFGLHDLGYVGKWVGMSTLIGLVGGFAALGFDWLLHVLREYGLKAATGVDLKWEVRRIGFAGEEG